MPYHQLEKLLSAELAALEGAGRLKGKEAVIAGIVPPTDDKGPRYLLEGEGEKPFLRMNSNSYLGLPMVKALVEAGEAAVRAFGTGPGAVRFISGTWAPHVELERRLAAFHGRGLGTPLEEIAEGLLVDDAETAADGGQRLDLHRLRQLAPLPVGAVQHRQTLRYRVTTEHQQCQVRHRTTNHTGNRRKYSCPRAILKSFRRLPVSTAITRALRTRGVK